MSSFIVYTEDHGKTKDTFPSSQKSKPSFKRSSSTSSNSSDSRHSSISSEICDLIDSNRKITKKNSSLKIKVPWASKDHEHEHIRCVDPIHFSYSTINALRHVFNLLDSKAQNSGRVAKSRLQVICATVCMVFDVKHDADELQLFNGDNTDLSFDALISYLSAVLTRAEKQAADQTKVELTAWAIISKENRDCCSVKFSDDMLFKLWQMFNRLICDDSTSLHVEEVSLFIKNFMVAIGCEWNPEPLEDFTDSSRMSFWELVRCMETEYLSETPESVYMEGITTLCCQYIDEVSKEGWLLKKGHRVKNIKERWFVFTPHLITYYETNKMMKKKGDIVINPKSKVESIADSKSTKCRFDVTCGLSNKLFELEASDQRTKNEWIISIKCQISLDEEVSPLMMELSERADKRVQKQQMELREEIQRKQQQELLQLQQQELEKTRLALDEAHIQVETESSLRDEERRRRVEMEVMKSEYETMLERERKAREEENVARLRQEELLGEETQKRVELERIKKEQDEILTLEREMREGLEQLSKEQTKVLDKERERLKELEEAQKSAEVELAQAHQRLEASEKASREAASRVEEAKQRTRLMTGSGGLNRIINLSQVRPITHRGVGAFVEEDFSKTPLYLQQEQQQHEHEVVNRTIEEDTLQSVS